jgi:hypothetical protein
MTGPTENQTLAHLPDELMTEACFWGIVIRRKRALIALLK